MEQRKWEIITIPGFTVFHKGSFALGDNDDDKVDLNKSLQMGCMATKETIRTRWRRQIRLQQRHSEWVLHLFGRRRCDKNNIVATGWPSLRRLSAAFVYIFRYLLKCHLLLNFNKIC